MDTLHHRGRHRPLPGLVDAASVRSVNADAMDASAHLWYGQMLAQTGRFKDGAREVRLST